MLRQACHIIVMSLNALRVFGETSPLSYTCSQAIDFSFFFCRKDLSCNLGGLQLEILRPQPLESWYYRHIVSCYLYYVVFFETRSLVAQAGLEFCYVAEADFELSSLASTFLGS